VDSPQRRTRRQALGDHLAEREWSFEELRAVFSIPVHLLEDDLQHLERSLRRLERPGAGAELGAAGEGVDLSRLHQKPLVVVGGGGELGRQAVVEPAPRTIEPALVPERQQLVDQVRAQRVHVNRSRHARGTITMRLRRAVASRRP